MSDYKLELNDTELSETETDNSCSWTPEALTAFTNLLTSYIKISANDLEAFARHAKRSTINVDDVKLLCRRNPTLENELNNKLKDK